MWLLLKEGLQVVNLGLDAGVCLLALTTQGWHLGVLGEVCGAGWKDSSLDHVDHSFHFDAQSCDVALIHDLLAGQTLLGAEYLHVTEDLLVGVCCELGDCQWSVVQVWQTPLLRFLRPLSGVAIAGEDNFSVLLEHCRHSVPVAHATLDHASQICHTGRHDGVANGNGEGAVLRRAHSPELEAVSAEWEGSRSVPVLDTTWCSHCCGGLGVGQLLLSLVSQKWTTTNDGIDVSLEAGAWVQRDDGRWCLLCSQAVVVSRVRNRAAHQAVVLHETIGERRDACDEQLSSRVGLARVEKVEAGVGSNGPVVVLARAVDAGEWLLVEKDMQADLLGLL
mmetsp:Transcript_40929/g.96129  ORF Transcript_40929/g.96129 Transcript_40929/m.96129 type:complete len:335 (-) Transcript_40929:1034-2038(-)